MNWEHLKTYIWVRWRLSVNQVKKSGTGGAVIAVILNALRVIGGFVTFITGLLVGLLALNQADPKIVMMVWDGVAAGFIFFWFIGLMSELQRSELLSLNNFMHLPVSPSGAFLINYVGSSVGLSLIFFLPAMVGLSLGMTLSQGVAMLSLFPLVGSFLLMVTAVTYQFRGWLASMVANPRRRRTIIAVLTIAFILAFNIPNILNNMGPGVRAKRAASQEAKRELALLNEQHSSGGVTEEEYEKQLASKTAALEADRKRELDKNFEILRMTNMVVPLGWLPYGAGAAAQGKSLPVSACILGMGLIGIASLRRSYISTIRLYLGDFSKGRDRRKVKKKMVSEVSDRTITGPDSAPAFMEKDLPRMSEYASVVALAGFRSLLRAPEVKMILMSPVIMIVLAVMMFSVRGDVPDLVRPLIALGFAALILIISMFGLVGNQFAFDRNGFRTFVLSGAPRREILLGKNLSMLPIAVTLMAIAVIVTQWMYPMRPDHFVAALVQLLPIYLLFCLAGNMLAILSPITLKSGSGQPAPHQGVRLFFQTVFMCVIPIPIALTLIPLGIEALFVSTGWSVGFPAFLTLGLIQAVLVLWLYRKALGWQGRLLQQCEQKILEIVSRKGD